MVCSPLVCVVEGDAAWVDSGKEKTNYKSLASCVHNFNLKCTCNLPPAFFEA